MIVRGICCLVPSARGPGKNIEVIRILDRVPGQARGYVFGHGGDEQGNFSSADWMNRNLSHRIETAIPVYDPAIRQRIRAIIDIQLADTVKARIIDKAQDNAYRTGATEVRSQFAIREYLASTQA